MSLPRLKDYLSTDLDLGRDVPLAPAAGEAKAALDEYERSLDRVAGKAERLRQALNRFVEDVEGFQPLTEADTETAFREIEALESRVQSSSREGLRAAETRRKKFALLRDGDLKFRAVALHDREVGTVRSILTAYDQAKRRLLKLRDRVLVEEAQEMSAGAFWGDDDL